MKQESPCFSCGECQANTNQAVKDNVDEEDRMSWSDDDNFGTCDGITIPPMVGDLPDTLFRVEDLPHAKSLSITDKLGRKQCPTFINESGVYSLILRSNLPSAKKFKRWITSEVLPAIRKTGGYISGEEHMTDDELLAKALQIANRKIELRDQKIKEMEPKVDCYDNLVSSKGKYNLRESAAVLGITQNEFIRFLISNHYMYRNPLGELRAYSPGLKSDPPLFVARQFKKTNSSNTGVQYLLTPSGIDKIYKQLRRKGETKT